MQYLLTLDYYQVEALHGILSNFLDNEADEFKNLPGNLKAQTEGAFADLRHQLDVAQTLVPQLEQALEGMR